MEGPTSIFQHKSCPQFLVNRMPFSNDYGYKNFSEETDENVKVTDENANDVVDMAPHRWKKPAQKPTEPLTKNPIGEKQRSFQFMFSQSQKTKAVLTKMVEEENLNNVEKVEKIDVNEKVHPMEESTPPLKEVKKNVFSNLFRPRQAKKPFFSRNKNKLE